MMGMKHTPLKAYNETRSSHGQTGPVKNMASLEHKTSEKGEKELSLQMQIGIDGEKP